eukprot:CAMPEP_0170465584 /NCGR_PEP_ID=MMETSP0123-20130129/9880_1 /TAXON_ID=182087 /ORGANISM="Favella ehrenbergii, Strain Fehren 1" /LENGTH=157 /DNA_ID=CAMNT_0010731531 /DNA_START=817 /DNA_END=1291 /DNA_ORIENTATION=-
MAIAAEIETHDLVDDADSDVLEALECPALVEEVADLKNLAVATYLNRSQLVEVLLKRDLLEVYLAREEADCRRLVYKVRAQICVILFTNGALQRDSVEKYALPPRDRLAVVDQSRAYGGLHHGEDAALTEVCNAPRRQLPQHDVELAERGSFLDEVD